MLKHAIHHGKKVANHVKEHHKKYLFSLIWWWLFIKLAIFMLTGLWLSVSLNTNADVQTWCVWTGEYMTWEYFTWEYYTWEYMSGQYLTWWEFVKWYYTWEYLTGGYYTWEYLTWCYSTWEYLTGGYFSGDLRTWEYNTWLYITWCYTTWEYFTWEYLTWEYYVDEYMSGQYLTWWELIEWYYTWGYLTWEYSTWWYRTDCVTLSCEPSDLEIVNPDWNNVKWLFDIEWSYKNDDCLLSENIKQLNIQLYDHNKIRIDLWTVASTETKIEFNSALLEGIYDESWVQLSWLYTVTWTDLSWQVYNVFTWLYDWVYADYATGYQVKITDESWAVFYLWDTTPFIIDNVIPTITWISVSLNWVRNSYIWLSWTTKISFIADEELSWTVVNVRGREAELVLVSGLVYYYEQTLTTENTEWDLVFDISYQDLAGNAGEYSSFWPITFDKTTPEIEEFTLSWDDQQWFILSRKTSEDTIYKLLYSIDDWAAQEVLGSEFANSFEFTINDLGIWQVLDFSLDIEDKIWNKTDHAWTIEISNDGMVVFDYDVAWYSTAEVTEWEEQIYNWVTWSIATFANTLKNEINKYNECKNSISYKELNLKLEWRDFLLNMPNFGKDSMKTIVNAFLIYSIEQMKETWNITDENINLITRKFNNFLVVLKLVRDDENDCRQSLSNYHILQFQKTMKELNIEL